MAEAADSSRGLLPTLCGCQPTLLHLTPVAPTQEQEKATNDKPAHDSREAHGSPFGLSQYERGGGVLPLQKMPIGYT